MTTGIDAIAFYVPSLYVDIKDIAQKRQIESAKLEKGLGLKKMAFCDVHEDTATMAANALLKIIEDYNINPTQISRIYLGTESSLDAAKSTMSMAVKMVEDQLIAQYGPRCFKNCDVLDMTFACIGAVDALENCLDFVRLNPHKKAIVIASDYAKYSLDSSGEYTQGAGAVAMLIAQNPRLMAIEPNWGMACESVYDFFKPRRLHQNHEAYQALSHDEVFEVFSDEPIFDGQYSNECFKLRISEAYQHLKSERNTTEILFEKWHSIAFHLPYAFHGKRIFSDIFAQEYQLPAQNNEDLKNISQSPEYKKLVEDKIEPSQRASSEIGNMYTASIFMALLSALQVAFDKQSPIEGQSIGFISYGSGSKAKVFTGTVMPAWQDIMSHTQLFQSLEKRINIDFDTYEKLHKKAQKTPIEANYKGFALDYIEQENPLLKGARIYKYMA